MTKKNRGSAVVEATLLLPIFLFAMLAIYRIFMIRLAEWGVYESAIETVEYMSEYAYVSGEGFMLPDLKFKGYVDDTGLVDSYIDGGIAGVSFLGTIPIDEDDNVVLRVAYSVNGSSRAYTITQRGYVGDRDAGDESDAKNKEEYVFVTDNKDVYHVTRDCTYLTLSIRGESLELAKKSGYERCEFCGEGCKAYVFVTDTGGKYHSSETCSGLKRSVYRVTLSSLGGIPKCSRCAN